MGVDAQEEVLDDQQVGVVGNVPGRLPAAGSWHDSLLSPQVVRREGGREDIHALAVDEATVVDRRRDALGDA